MKRIRTQLMDDSGEPLGGDVEIDETSWGGKPRVPLTREGAAAFHEAKPTILGMVERGGRIRFRVIRRGAGRRLVERSGQTSTPRRSSSPMTGRPTSRCAASS